MKQALKQPMQQLSRRSFLTGITASGISLTLGASLSGCSSNINNSTQVITGGYSRTDNNGKRLKEYGVLAFQVINNSKHSLENYQILANFSVPYEVHFSTVCPDKRSLLICSRKPEASLLKYSFGGELLAELKPPSNLHFEGHVIYSVDEKHIYATASNYQQGKGKLLKLNSLDLSIIGMYDSGGIGPHELVWQSNHVIALANTGVLTHPESGRKILNSEAIQSNVVLFNSRNEKIEYQWDVPLPSLSARHLDRMDNGDLVIGCQYKKEDQRPPCVAFASKHKALVFADTQNESLHWDMKGYSASIKSIPNTNQALISNPRGHLLTQWVNDPLKKKQYTQLKRRHRFKFNKGIAISKTGQQAWISKGPGELLSLNLASGEIEGSAIKIKGDIWWANHLG